MAATSSRTVGQRGREAANEQRAASSANRHASVGDSLCVLRAYWNHRIVRHHDAAADWTVGASAGCLHHHDHHYRLQHCC